MKYKYNVIFAVIAALLVVFIFWLGGWNVNERGSIAVLCALFSLSAAAMGWLLADC